MLKIAVVTGTRADFGLLDPLLRGIVTDTATELQLVVTGMHLSPEFGMTVQEVRSSGYRVADEIEILLSSDTGTGTAKSVGLATVGFADSFRRLDPDWIVLLGDRFEILAAAVAAFFQGIPVAHIHGGERTDGALDDAIRHAITKMSVLHFVSTKDYQRRVIQLGENPITVHHVGAIGLDRIDFSELITKSELAKYLGIDGTKPWCTVTFHPVTTRPGEVRTNINELISVLKTISDMEFVITKANADENGRLINSLMEEFVATVDNAVLVDSLGSKRYLSCVQASALVLGNSSSGILEAPFLKTPTVDIGDRQGGRIRGKSVIHAEPIASRILYAIQKARALADAAVYEENPYYNGGAAKRILEAIKNTEPSTRKTFFDLDFDITDLD